MKSASDIRRERYEAQKTKYLTEMKQIQDLRNQNKSDKEIALQTGKSLSTIRMVK